MTTRQLAGSMLVAVGLAVVISACGGDEATLASPTADVSRGAELYTQTCASCHGADLRGTERGPSHLSIVYEPNHHGDDAFRSAIANGAPQHHWDFGPMPPVDGLSPDDVDAIVAFVRAAQEREGFER